MMKVLTIVGALVAAGWMGVAPALFAQHGAGAPEAEELSGAARAPVAAGVFSERERAAIDTLVRDLLERHPELVAEALAALDARRAAEARARDARLVEAHAQALFADPATPWAGEGEVAVVEFFDYECGYCKSAVRSIERLLELRGEHVRFVYKEFPILGSRSRAAAHAALAAGRQDLYREMHDALMGAPKPVDSGKLRAAGALIGADVDRLMADMADPRLAAQVEANHALAGVLGIRGTPAFVIGDTIVRGMVSGENLAALVDAELARRDGR